MSRIGEETFLSWLEMLSDIHLLQIKISRAQCSSSSSQSDFTGLYKDNCVRIRKSKGHRAAEHKVVGLICLTLSPKESLMLHFLLIVLSFVGPPGCAGSQQSVLKADSPLLTLSSGVLASGKQHGRNPCLSARAPESFRLCWPKAARLTAVYPGLSSRALIAD